MLNVKNEMHIMENIVEKQTNERGELSRLRMAWHLKAIQGKPVREQWEMFKEKLKKVRKRAGRWLGARPSLRKALRLDPSVENKQSAKAQKPSGSAYLQSHSQIQKQRSEWRLPENAGREEGMGCCLTGSEDLFRLMSAVYKWMVVT